MKVSYTMIASAIVISLAISGCAVNNKTAPSTSSSGQTTKMEQTPSVIKDGVTKMLSITADLKKAIDDGDEAKVKGTGPKLEDAWRPFEDNVKQKYLDIYKKVEKYLDPTIAGSKISPLDKQELGKLNGELTQVLNELASKEK